ncbi:hypothetical protein FA95DRAFT_1609312 [Auriscalpium vulgare]|uniref:Uncharacterized protein n=1 Tax=Auriscalpium vulgare TaxID=40419 RepID=A0ACB8RIQ4_9AGAM|nr:hypothetical protein FA95DRAFT_1609312 [Auriscalpium vulgare]
MSDYVLMLNNHLQATGDIYYFTWDYGHSGPEHQANHYAYAKLRGQVVAVGTATSRSVAKQHAAYQFLRVCGVLH